LHLHKDEFDPTIKFERLDWQIEKLGDELDPQSKVEGSKHLFCKRERERGELFPEKISEKANPYLLEKVVFVDRLLEKGCIIKVKHV
jgi:hypothetical protein